MERTDRHRSVLRRLLRGAFVFTTLTAGQAIEPAAPVIVTATGHPGGAYEQPAWAARSRTSATTDAYVLSPFNAYVGATFEATTPQHGKNENRLTPEIEIGLPHRFQVAVETDISQIGRRVENRTVNLELRYAFADWGRIPLNPTLFVEYKFGTGSERETESEREAEKPGADAEDADAPAEMEARKREVTTSHARPDSVELRLLLSQNFSEHVEWALNGFWEQEVGLDREREIGFSQSLVYSFGKGSVKTGVEMQFISTTRKDTRGDATNSFVIGPSLAVQLSRHARLDFAPLFGIGHDSPRVSAFAIFSYDFGSEGEGDAQAPVSTRNR